MAQNALDRTRKFRKSISAHSLIFTNQIVTSYNVLGDHAIFMVVYDQEQFHIVHVFKIS